MTKKVLISIFDWAKIEVKLSKRLRISPNSTPINTVTKIFLEWFEDQPEVKDEKSVD